MLPDSVCCSRLVKMARMSKFVLSAQIGAWQADELTCAFENVSGVAFWRKLTLLLCAVSHVEPLRIQDRLLRAPRRLWRGVRRGDLRAGRLRGRAKVRCAHDA